MKEASGEVSMTLIVIVAAAVILGIIYALSPTIKGYIEQMWGNFTSKTDEGLQKGQSSMIVIPGYTIELNK